MKELRERGRMSIGDVERCMKIPKDTYRHIERRRRPLPTIDHGLIAFVRAFLKCVGATINDEEAVMQLASQYVLDQFEDWLEDLRNRRTNRHE